MILSRMKAKQRQVEQWLGLARSVRQVKGKGVLSQLLEIAKLRSAAGKLSISEYYNYGLYDDHCFSPSGKREFIGAKLSAKLYGQLNHRFWRAIATDKLILYSMLQSLGLPFPRLYAIYQSNRRFCGTVPCFTEKDALADFLRHEISYPFFSKPVNGAHGAGASAVMGLDGSSDELILANGAKVSVERYVAELPSLGRFGHLFQECLTPHPIIEEICGGHVSSVRMIVLLCQDGPRLLRAVWKVPSGRNMTDNFNHGASGNMLGCVDVKTGLVKRVITGVGLQQSEVISHPDTAQPVTGFTLPDWRDLVDICLTGATAIPGLHLQHWDIAICPKGPVFLELNSNGDLDLPQHAYHAGLYDSQFKTFLSQV